MPEIATGPNLPTHAAEPGTRYQQASKVVSSLWEMGADGRWALVGEPQYRRLRRTARRLDHDHDTEAECAADFQHQETEEERKRRASFDAVYLGPTNPPIDRRPADQEGQATWCLRHDEAGRVVWVRGMSNQPPDIIVV